MKNAGIIIGVLVFCSGILPSIGAAAGAEDIEKEIQKELRLSPVWAEKAGYLGVLLRNITAEDVVELGLPAEMGVFLAEIVKNSPAEKAGLMEGDVIIECLSMPVRSVMQFQRMVRETPPGREVQIKVYRDKEVRELLVEVGSLEGARKTPGIFHVPAPVQGEDGRIFRFPEGVYEHVPGFVSEIFRRRPALGIEGAPMTAQLADYMGIDEVEGVLVTAVLEGTPASSAGVKAGDLITAVNGRKVRGPMDLRNSLKKGVLKLDMVRNRKKMSLEVNIVTPEEKDSPRETFRM